MTLNTCKHLACIIRKNGVARLLSKANTMLVTAIVMVSLYGCMTEKLEHNNSNTQNQEVKLSLNVPAMPVFEDEVSAVTRAVPGGNVGKTSWEDGDQVLALLTLKNSDSNASMYKFYFSMIYKNNAWIIPGKEDVDEVADLKVIKSLYKNSNYTHTIMTNSPYIKMTTSGKINFPKDEITISNYDLVLYYVPGQEWCNVDQDGISGVSYSPAFPAVAEDENTKHGTGEAWISKQFGEFKENFSITHTTNWEALTIRIRIRGIGGSKATLEGTNLNWSGYLNTDGTSFYKGTKKQSTTLDTDGNTFYYVSWNYDANEVLPRITVKIEDSNFGDIADSDVVFSSAFNKSSTAGDALVIDGLHGAIVARIIDNEVKLIGNTDSENWVVCRDNSGGIITDSLMCITIKKALSLSSSNIHLTLMDVERICFQGFFELSSLVSINCPNVTEIGDVAFRNCKNLISANFPKAIKIKDQGFTQCTNLTNAYFPEVTNISLIAFDTCSSLKDVYIPKAINIGSNAFRRCTNLTHIDLPEVTQIEDYAFHKCTNLVSVNAPKVTEIGYVVFSKCENLTSINIPNATKVGQYTFNGCSKLASIYIPELDSLRSGLLADCSSLTTVHFPKVTKIKKTALSGCTNLISASFPNATHIEDDAFDQCENLKTLIFGPLEDIEFNGLLGIPTTEIDLIFTNEPIEKPVMSDEGILWQRSIWKSFNILK